MIIIKMSRSNHAAWAYRCAISNQYKYDTRARTNALTREMERKRARESEKIGPLAVNCRFASDSFSFTIPLLYESAIQFAFMSVY